MSSVASKDSSQQGFSLLEMMIVLAVIAIILTLAMPSGRGKLNRAEIAESLALVEGYQRDVAAYFLLNGRFPVDNEELGMPDADRIRGNYLSRMELDRGALQLQLGNKAHPSLKGRWLSLRPAYVGGEPSVPISWLCGFDTVPEGMIAGGENRTDVVVGDLPFKCRARQSD